MTQDAPTQRRARALVVTADMPDPLGTPPQRSAWAMVEAAASGYRVELVVVGRDPVHLEAWEAALALSERVVLGAGREALPPGSGAAGDVAYDLLVCRGVRGWALARGVEASARVLDLRDTGGGLGGRDATRRLAGLWRRCGAAHGLRRQRSAARACGQVLVSSQEHARVLALPPGVRARVVTPGDRQALRRALCAGSAPRSAAAAGAALGHAVPIRTAA